MGELPQVLHLISKLEAVLESGWLLPIIKKTGRGKSGLTTHGSQEPGQTASPPEEGLVFSAPLPSGSHLASVFLIKDGCNLVPFTLLTQGPEKFRVPRQRASATFNLTSWLNQQGGAKLRADCRESRQRKQTPESGIQDPETSLCAQQC